MHVISGLEGVEFHFFGPITIDVPIHERLKFYGSVPHANLIERAQPFDAFVMPFVINELIQGVDPVKLYEYININKNIICPYYAEIDRFSEFVSFYRNKKEFSSIVKELMINNDLKYNSKKRSDFLEGNCWPVRKMEVTRLINNQL
ncbi:hypothetical protein LP414_33160 [Polaromonas sp. P1(28)-13]|nr:hypothetical protein LP414_33160 [Polaromonas sp. P1(28)-13]